jgi:anti-anti-sigma factor
MQVEHADGVTRVVISENLVASQAKEIKTKLKQLVEEGHIKVVIDLRGIESIDSSGIGVLVAAQNSLKAQGETLTIENVSEKIFRMMKTMRLDRHMNVIQG